MSDKIDGYDVESMGYGFVSIFDWSTTDYLVIDTPEQARLIANAILKICENENADNSKHDKRGLSKGQRHQQNRS